MAAAGGFHSVDRLNLASSELKMTGVVVCALVCTFSINLCRARYASSLKVVFFRWRETRPHVMMIELDENGPVVDQSLGPRKTHTHTHASIAHSISASKLSVNELGSAIIDIGFGKSQRGPHVQQC